MIRRYVVMLIATGVVLGGIFGWKFFAGMQMQKSMASMTLPPATVSTSTARADVWNPIIPAIGSLRALQGVDVTAQLAGQITELHFESGDSAKAGDLLVRQFTAADEARLAGLRADTALAEANLRRAEELVAKDLVSATDYDTRKTELQRARAAEASLEVTIEQKTIRAPFSGRLGIRHVDIGQYVEPGDPIVRLESFEQIRVNFPVPQRYLGQLRVGQGISVTNDAWPGEEFSGTVTAIEPQVASDTRTIRLQGIVSNVDERLLPGMFVKVSIELPAEEQVVTVPQSVVTYSPYGDSVFVIADDPDSGEPVARNTFVEIGATRGDQVAILNGLAPGDIVVTAGQQKLRNGTRVVVDNTVQVSDRADPQPANN